MSHATPNPDRCKGINKKGFRCAKDVIPDTDYCFLHTPENREYVLSSASKASQAFSQKVKKLKKVTIHDITDVLEVQRRAIQQIGRAENPGVKQLQALASLSNSFAKLLKDQALFDRNAELERAKKNNSR